MGEKLCLRCGNRYSKPKGFPQLKDNRKPTKKTLSHDHVDNLIKEAQQILNGVQQESNLSELGQIYKTVTKNGVEFKAKSILGQDFLEINTDMESPSQRASRLAEQGIPSEDPTYYGPPYYPTPYPGPGPEPPIPPPNPWPVPPPRTWPGPGPGDPCVCDDAWIGYTSTGMGVGETQQLTANGGGNGCEYSWGISGGGSLSSGSGASVIYTAPAINVNCSLNPIITLLCEGMAVANLALAINASPDLFALLQKNTCTWSGPDNYCFCYCGSVWTWADNRYLKMSCDGTFYGYHDTYVCSGPEFYCPDNGPKNNQPAWCDAPNCPSVVDYRTEEQKAAGCCPPQLI